MSGGKVIVALDPIRIYHECEGRIEKSVRKITIWHHQACRVMTNGDPEGRIFLSYLRTNIGFFLMLITYFIKIHVVSDISN